MLMMRKVLCYTHSLSKQQILKWTKLHLDAYLVTAEVIWNRMLTQDESSNTSYLYLSGVGRKEVYVITLVYRTIPIKISVNSLFIKDLYWLLKIDKKPNLGG
jgi:hypothetical protein